MSEAAKKFMTMSIWITLVIFIIRSWIGWSELSEAVNSGNVLGCGYSLFGYAGEAIGIATLFMTAFNLWLWRFRTFNFIAGGMPVLAKKYTGKIKFHWDGQDQERETTIGIEQTFLNITVDLYTNESTSKSITASIENKQLIYTYLNTPRAEIQDRSAVHFGTAMLKLDNPQHLTGNYYTGRLSRGSMDLQAD